MPVRNAAPFLRQSIESVLAQGGPSLELLIVDDGSTDGSVELAESVGDRRIRVCRHARRGLVATLNAGLAAARGE